MENEMSTLSEIITKMTKEGYNSEIIPDEMDSLIADEWLIDRTFRFEGKSNPDDNSILYALSKKDGTRKSLVVNGYGVYNSSVINNFVQQLHYHEK